MYLEFDWTFHFRKNSSQYHWKNKNYHIRLNIFCRLLLIFIQSHLCFLKNHFFQNHFLFFKLSPQRAAVVSEPYSLFPYTKIDRKQSTIRPWIIPTVSSKIIQSSKTLVHRGRSHYLNQKIVIILSFLGSNCGNGFEEHDFLSFEYFWDIPIPALKKTAIIVWMATRFIILSCLQINT